MYLNKHFMTFMTQQQKATTDKCIIAFYRFRSLNLKLEQLCVLQNMNMKIKQNNATKKREN